MIDEQDIKKLTVVFPTRDELNARLDEFATKADLEEGLHQTTQVLLDAMDKIAQEIDVMKYEYATIWLKRDRHINDKSVHYG